MPAPTKDPNDEILDAVKGVAKTIETVQGQCTELENKQQKLLSDADRLDRDTKKILLDIDSIKKHSNDVDTRLKQVTEWNKSLKQQMAHEVRWAYGDPIERISRDEEMRLRLNTAICQAVNKDGALSKRIKTNLERLKAIGADLETKALGEDSGFGSSLIDQKLLLEVYDTLSRFGIWNTLKVYNVGSKLQSLPVKTTRPVANFMLTESAAAADDANTAGSPVTLETELITVFLNVSMQLLEDAEIDVTSSILDDFIQAVAYRMDYACFIANGAASTAEGGMTGLTNFATLVAAAAGEATVETLDQEDFQACLLACDASVLSRPAKWWMHPHILVRVLSVKDANGRPIFMNALEAPNAGGIGSILGAPVILGDALNSSNSANTRIAVYGDPGAMAVGVRRGFEFASSDHFRFPNNDRSFRGTFRGGCKGRIATGAAVLRLTT